ncbi:MAG: hypothetical protein ACP5P3_03780 [Ignavibacteria bacterium]
MKNLILISIFSFIITASSIVQGQPNKQIYEIGYLKVYTSQTYFYDDGVYRKEYSPFFILDENRNVIMKVGRALDEPFIIGLKIGEYFIIQESNNTVPSRHEIKLTIASPTLKEVKVDQ